MIKIFRQPWVPILGMTVAALTIYLRLTGYGVTKIEAASSSEAAVLTETATR